VLPLLSIAFCSFISLENFGLWEKSKLFVEKKKKNAVFFVLLASKRNVSSVF